VSILNFTYKMEIGYEKDVGKCHFTIKCIPKEDARQQLLEMELSIFPQTSYCFGEDSFGNRQLYGSESEPHKQFVFEISGRVKIIQTDFEEQAREENVGIFRFPYGKCVAGPGLIKYFHSLGPSGYTEAYDICMDVMHRLHKDFSYKPGITNFNTTAEEAWSLAGGVCQDYAHIYIALLRMYKIPARYVCGLMIGEGASHAWVEALCENRWVPFDPTNDCRVLNDYIKLGHGRDASDCAINRGLMWNGGAQSQKISVSVWEQK